MPVRAEQMQICGDRPRRVASSAKNRIGALNARVGQCSRVDGSGNRGGSTSVPYADHGDLCSSLSPTTRSCGSFVSILELAAALR
jgi:hypothetical protein